MIGPIAFTGVLLTADTVIADTNKASSDCEFVWESGVSKTLKLEGIFALTMGEAEAGGRFMQDQLPV